MLISSRRVHAESKLIKVMEFGFSFASFICLKTTKASFGELLQILKTGSKESFTLKEKEKGISKFKRVVNRIGFYVLVVNPYFDPEKVFENKHKTHRIIVSH